MSVVKEGWRTTRKQAAIILLLFMYQIGLGIFLYKFVKSIVQPLLLRYPGSDLPADAMKVYMAESHFQLSKTDLLYGYMWIVIAWIALRMIVAPLINAGLYYALHDPEGSRGRTFFKGMRLMAKPFYMLYALQTALIFLPFLWLVPLWQSMLAHATSYEGILIQALPWLAGWLVYGGILKIVFMYLQFGTVGGVKLAHTLWLMLRHPFSITRIALTVFFISGAIGLVILSATLYWAGLFALILHQTYYLFKAMFNIWAIAAQYHHWSKLTHQ